MLELSKYTCNGCDHSCVVDYEFSLISLESDYCSGCPCQVKLGCTIKTYQKETCQFMTVDVTNNSISLTPTEDGRSAQCTVAWICETDH